MSKTLKTFRVEKKYEMDEITKKSMIRKLKHVMNYDDNDEGDGYIVRSLYFDSITDEDYMAKLEGLEVRKKIRLRIYSADAEFVKLEIKKKQGIAQQKKSLLISREEAKSMIRGNFEFLLSRDSDTAYEIYNIMKLGVYRPKCIVEYDRIAFDEPINTIRITFDSNVRVSKNYESFFDKDLSFIPLLTVPIMEVKYNRFLLDPIQLVIQSVDALEVSFSKYSLGRDRIG